jgi:hypothetical protein
MTTKYISSTYCIQDCEVSRKREVEGLGDLGCGHRCGQGPVPGNRGAGTMVNTATSPPQSCDMKPERDALSTSHIRKHDSVGSQTLLLFLWACGKGWGTTTVIQP